MPAQDVSRTYQPRIKAYQSRLADKYREISDDKLEDSSEEVDETISRMSEDENVAANEPEIVALNDLDENDDKKEESVKPDDEIDEKNESLDAMITDDKLEDISKEEAVDEVEVETPPEDVVLNDLKDEENDESVKSDDEIVVANESLEAMIQEVKAAGDYADLFGTNQHYDIPSTYQDLGRRFVLRYPYVEKKPLKDQDAALSKLDNAIKQHMAAKKADIRLLPYKAPPEFVLEIAKQSAHLESMLPKKPINNIKKKEILRTGNYWDGVWKEDLDVNKVLRSSNKKQNELESVTVEISPGSKLYDLISVLQQKSPRLLYVINKRNYK